LRYYKFLTLVVFLPATCWSKNWIKIIFSNYDLWL